MDRHERPHHGVGNFIGLKRHHRGVTANDLVMGQCLALACRLRKRCFFPSQHACFPQVKMCSIATHRKNFGSLRLICQVRKVGKCHLFRSASADSALGGKSMHAQWCLLCKPFSPLAQYCLALKTDRLLSPAHRLALLARRQARLVWLQVLRCPRTAPALGHAPADPPSQDQPATRHRHGGTGPGPVCRYPNLNVKEPTVRASTTLTPARATGATNPNLSAAQAGVGTNPCLVNICNQRGALRATIRAS